MTVLIIGGTGFIGRRLIPLLAQRGEELVVMDINPQTANFSELTKVKVLSGDVSQFDDVMAVMTKVKPDRVVNLAYYISSELPPRRVQAEYPRYGQLLRGGAARGVQPSRLRQFGGGQRRTKILRRAHRQ